MHLCWYYIITASSQCTILSQFLGATLIYHGWNRLITVHRLMKIVTILFTLHIKKDNSKYKLKTAPPPFSHLGVVSFPIPTTPTSTCLSAMVCLKKDFVKSPNSFENLSIQCTIWYGSISLCFIIKRTLNSIRFFLLKLKNHSLFKHLKFLIYRSMNIYICRCIIHMWNHIIHIRD